MHVDKLEVTIGHNDGGWYVEWFRDGEPPLAARWYGSRHEVNERKKLRPPKLRPMRSGEFDSYADLARDGRAA